MRYCLIVSAFVAILSVVPGISRSDVSDQSNIGVSLADFLPGDANENNTVDKADLDIVLSNYNRTGSVWTDGDFDYNTTVNGADLTVVLSNYGRSIVGVPEPASLALLGVGGIGLLAFLWRKRR